MYLCSAIVWIRQLLKKIGLDRNHLTRVLIENSSAQHLAHNLVNCQWSKHIDIEYHWIRDKITDGVVQLVNVTITNQRADFLNQDFFLGRVFHRHACVNIYHVTCILGFGRTNLTCIPSCYS